MKLKTQKTRELGLHNSVDKLQKEYKNGWKHHRFNRRTRRKTRNQL